MGSIDHEANGLRQFVTLGMFIIDEFVFLDEKEQPTGRSLPPQVPFFSLKLPCAISK